MNQKEKISLDSKLQPVTNDVGQCARGTFPMLCAKLAGVEPAKPGEKLLPS